MICMSDFTGILRKNKLLITESQALQNSCLLAGFVYNLDSARLTSMKKIQDLQIDEWIDRYTRAVFAEFTVYNAHTNFFGVVTMLTEILPTGGYHHYPKVNTIRLYRYTGPEQVVVMAFEFVFFAFLCVYVYSEAKQLFVLGKKYFADPWNYIEIVVICSSFSAIFLYLAELGFTKLAIRRMRANPEAFISFDYIIFLDEAFLGTLGFAVFCAFLKFLKLLRFNRRMSMLVQTVKVSSAPLLSFFFIFLLFFTAYTQAAFLMFGPVNEDYSSFVVAAETMLSMTLGGFDFTGLQNANRLIGPIFFISYMVFIFLILVNVFLSIVNDSFAEVSSDVAKQTNEHEVVDYIVYSVKEQIGRYVSPPFKPLYKPSLTDFERTVADIEDRAEDIVFAVDNLSLEEQRRENWFKIEKMNEKKAMLIRCLLHSNEDFDEDDFANAIPLMVKFLSEHTREELKHTLQKNRERRLSQFDMSSLSTEDSSDEVLYEDTDTEDSSISSLLDLENPTYSYLDVPSSFRSLHSIVEENAPSESGDNVQQGGNETSSHCKGDQVAVSISRATSLSDVYVEIPDQAEAEDNSSQLSTHL